MQLHYSSVRIQKQNTKIKVQDCVACKHRSDNKLFILETVSVSDTATQMLVNVHFCSVSLFLCKIHFCTDFFRIWIY